MSTIATVPMPPKWVSYWFAFTTVIVLWDAGYCFMRPRSFPDGDLSWIWWPYNRVPYGGIDLIYGTKAFDANDGFTNAQALLNLVEAVLNVEYLYLRHTSPHSLRLTPTDQSRPRYHAHAPLVGFAASLMTVSKTSLYFFQEYFCDFCMIGHNSLQEILQFYIATNVDSLSKLTKLRIWVIMPTVICVVLGRFITRRLLSDNANSIAYEEWLATQTAPRVASDEKVVVLPPVAPTVYLPADAPSIPPNAAASGSKPYPTPIPGAALPLTFTPLDSNVLIVGTNRLAATRIFALLEADATVLVLSTKSLEEAHEEVQHRVKSDQVEFVEEHLGSEEDWERFLSGRDVSLVCVTDTMIGSTQHEAMVAGETIAAVCRRLHIPVNISDHPAISTYSFPSTHRFTGADGVTQDSNLQVSVSTNGQGCRLSGRIKREIVTRLPVSVGAAVDNVGKLRTRARTRSMSMNVARGVGGRRLTNGVISEDDPETPLNIPVQQLDTASVLSGVNQQLDYFGGEGNNPDVPGGERLRRMRWVHQMSEYYSFEALARMSEEEMDKALSTWSTSSQSTLSLPQHEGGAQVVAGTSRQGRIFLIGSGPGHPGLLTLAAHHVLKSATVILSDKLVPAEILALIPKTTDLFIAKKFPGNNEGAQNELMVRALEAARKGEIVVRLKQGDPFVYGRGGEEVLYFRENGYECTVIPGVTSSIAGPEMFNIPVTQRGVSESMILCTGVGRQGKSVNLPGYIKSRSLVVLMGVARINQIVSTLVDDQSEGRDGAKYPPYLPIALIERASSPDQRLITSTLANIESAIKSVEERPPGMMLIGWSVLALEGKGRIDILDKKEQGDEEDVVKEWLGGDRWKVREGLDWGWGEFLGDLGRV